jgi:hypothetical protein
MLRVFMLNIIMLSVVMLNVIMISVPMYCRGGLCGNSQKALQKIFKGLYQQNPIISGYQVSLMNEEDPDWLRLRYLPLPKVLDEFLKELKITQGQML